MGYDSDAGTGPFFDAVPDEELWATYDEPPLQNSDAQPLDAPAATSATEAPVMGAPQLLDFLREVRCHKKAASDSE
jgi:hypothetical protein